MNEEILSCAKTGRKWWVLQNPLWEISASQKKKDGCVWEHASAHPILHGNNEYVRRNTEIGWMT